MSDFVKGVDRFCPRCENKKNISNFIPIYGTKDLYLPLCRNCIGKEYKKARDKFESEAAGICVAAGIMNVAAISDVIDMALKKIEVRNDKSNGFLIYYETLKELGNVYDGAMDSDVCLNDYVKIRKKVVKQIDDEVDYNQLSKLWGRFTDVDGELDAEAYGFLEDLFSKYTDGELNMDTAKEYTYRDLCIAHWQKRKADESGDMAEVEKAKKQINNGLSLLKLDKFQNNSLTDEEKHIEHLIWEIENTTPAECEDLEKYKDFSGFEKAFGSIMRCVKNLVVGSKEYPELTKEQVE